MFEMSMFNYHRHKSKCNDFFRHLFFLFLISIYYFVLKKQHVSIVCNSMSLTHRLLNELVEQKLLIQDSCFLERVNDAIFFYHILFSTTQNSHWSQISNKSSSTIDSSVSVLVAVAKPLAATAVGLSCLVTRVFRCIMILFLCFTFNISLFLPILIALL